MDEHCDATHRPRVAGCTATSTSIWFDRMWIRRTTCACEAFSLCLCIATPQRRASRFIHGNTYRSSVASASPHRRLNIHALCAYSSIERNRPGVLCRASQSNITMRIRWAWLLFSPPAEEHLSALRSSWYRPQFGQRLCLLLAA